MARPSNSFRTLGGGVPVHYDRLTRTSYGTRGVAQTFFATTDFESKLDRCFEQLWELSGLGEAEVITSAGAWVPKPGFHGSGRAFDLDGIFWPRKTFITLHAGFEGRDRPFYLAVEAVLRMHFGEVLNYDYNADHHDHFHISDLSPGFNPRKATQAFFVQNVLTFVLGRRVRIDGNFGPRSREALAAALSDMGISGSLENVDVWRRFLNAVAARVFQAGPDVDALATAATPAERPIGEHTPEELLQNVYNVIEQELGCTSLRPKIEGAVTAFVNHPDVQKLIPVSERDEQNDDESGDEKES